MDGELETNEEHVFEQLQNFLSNFSGDLNILEDKIDVSDQLEYFSYTAAFKEGNDIEDLLLKAHILTDVNFSNDDRKNLLCRLASVDDVRAFRVIETYLEIARNTEMYNWCRLAFEESLISDHSVQKGLLLLWKVATFPPVQTVQNRAD